MSLPRSGKTCRTAKTKCDSARPSCTRCLKRGRQCFYEADQGLVFRSENDTARMRSKRTSRAAQKTPLFINSPGLSHSSSLSTSALGLLVGLARSLQGHELVEDDFWQQQLPWLNRDAISQVPEPLKRDLQSRAVDRFFVDWILYPGNSGLFPGHLHVIPGLYHAAAPDSVLRSAVRALAFADMPKGSRDQASSYRTKAQKSYGLALTRMKELASDESSIVDDHVLAALLLIDNFELMYLARGRPLGNHCTAFKHILRARGNTQMYSGLSLALWRIAHHRLQAHQILLRQPPSSDQIEWISKLNSDVPSFHISSDILQMTILAATARELVEDDQILWSDEPETLYRAKQLSRRIETLLASLDDWTAHVGAPWQPSIVDAENLEQPKEIADGTPISKPSLVLQYADSWLAYMWNFHSACQIVLRESLLELMANLSLSQGENVYDLERGKQQAAVRNLCNTILQAFPPLLGFGIGWPSERAPMRQGRMAQKFFALFSLWIVQKAAYSLPEQKEQATIVVNWIMSSCRL